VDDPALAALSGVDARLVTTVAWALSSAMAALAGILFAPLVRLDAVALTLLVIQAFGAAALGRFDSLAGANLGAYAIGITAALVAKFAASTPGLVGLPTSLPFLVLFGVLVFSPSGAFHVDSRSSTAARIGSGAPATRRRYLTLGVAAAAAALAPLVVPATRMVTATQTVAFVLVFASLSLLLGTSRQLSLCHAVFVVFGATTASHLLHAGVPWPLAVVVAAATLVPVGAALAIPAVRLSGVFLALATFGFGVLCQYLLFPAAFTFGGDAAAPLRRPGGFGSDIGFFYLVLALTAAGVGAVEVVRGSRLGLTVRAVADSSDGAASIGLEPTTSRVLVFCLSAFLGAVGGVLLGAGVGTVVPTSFDFFQSLVWVAILVGAGALTGGGSILAALLYVTLPSWFNGATVTDWLPVAFGTAAILAASAPNGLVGLLNATTGERLADRFATRRAPRRHRERLAALEVR
jgi:ABC-type branched-subunit amino acid transport system permease subunit